MHRHFHEEAEIREVNSLRDGGGGQLRSSGAVEDAHNQKY